MTYREKFRAEHPDKDADMVHKFHCPKDPNNGRMVPCLDWVQSCRACWDREMEEVTEDGKETMPR